MNAQNDLHVHSNESDGQLSPELLIDAAIGNGVSAIALCDHDTTAGAKRFTQYGRSRGINAISGIELSAKWKGGNCHLLGLNVLSEYEPLEAILRKTRESRDRRNDLILEKLAEMDINISQEQLQSEAGGEVVARPHIALAMLKAGYVCSFREAFDKYLSSSGLAYVDRFRLGPADAVKILREAGAFVVLAHPRQLGFDNEKTGLFDLLIELKKAGLQGVEIYSPDTSGEQIQLYKEMSAALGLAQTGGSDFHAPGLGGREIGYYRPSVPIPKISVPELGM
ncbi:MAG: PHP domain-containing protein [Chitinispirillia bacterium]|nr:PHP domain-containing protein [Chitinispirillia bacterium]MCL2242664.1 PHP domain-containing protein [Chitinispirillia bacterium]